MQCCVQSLHAVRLWRMPERKGGLLWQRFGAGAILVCAILVNVQRNRCLDRATPHMVGAWPRLIYRATTLATEFTVDAASLRETISRNDWFNVEDVLTETDLVTRVWADEIANAASDHIADSRWEAFALAGIQQYANASSLAEVKIANLVKQAGYSRSTFFRVFDNLTKYQLHLYQLVSQLSTEVYAKRLFAKPRPPLEFAEFTINLFYSADCTIPNDWVATLWKKYGHVGHEKFHPQLSDISRTIAQYTQEHRSLGYNELAVSDVHPVVCLYEREVLESRLGAQPSFPAARQARRWKDLLFGLVADKRCLGQQSLSGKRDASFLKYYSS